MLFAPINIAIVDDHSLFRRMLQNFLQEQMNINVAIESPDVTDLFDKLENAPVDVLLMDVFLPYLPGNEAVKMIKDRYPGVKILMLSVSTDMNLISDLLDAGIHGYISKADEPEELLHAIR